MTVLELIERLQEVAKDGHGGYRVDCMSADDTDFGEVGSVVDRGGYDYGGARYIDLIATNPKDENVSEQNTDDRTFSMLSQAVKAAYRKHALDDPRIGWDELHTILADAIVAEMGDEKFCEWSERARKETE